MKDQDILDQVNKLVAEGLRPRPKGRGRLRAVEELGQCWDLLRQRRALRETGDPREAEVRPADKVEGYLN